MSEIVREFRPGGGNGVEPVSACWNFADGALGSASWNFGGDCREDLVQISGSKGRITFSVFDEVPLTLRANGGERSVFIENPQHIQAPHVGNMIRHLVTGEPHPSPGSEAAKTNWVMDAILASKR